MDTHPTPRISIYWGGTVCGQTSVELGISYKQRLTWSFIWHRCFSSVILYIHSHVKPWKQSIPSSDSGDAEEDEDKVVVEGVPT